MPGLDIKIGAGAFTADILRNETPNQLVTATLSSGSYGDYYAASILWYLHAPDVYGGTPPALGQAATYAGDNTFTPVFSGRYTITFSAIPTSGANDEANRINLTAVCECDPPFIDEAIPAPMESTEYSVTPTTPDGWARAVEKHLRVAQHMASDRKVVAVHNASGGALSKGDIVTTSAATTGPLQRYNGSGGGAYDASDFLTELSYDVEDADATMANIHRRPKLYVLDDIASGDKGLALMKGVVACDTTTALWTDGAWLYLSDAAGAMIPKATAIGGASTQYIPLARVIIGNRADPMDTANGPGQIYFNGEPGAWRAVEDVDTANPTAKPLDGHMVSYSAAADEMVWAAPAFAPALDKSQFVVDRTLTLVPSMGAPDNFSANMKSYVQQMDTTAYEPYVQFEADGGASTGDFYFYFVVDDEFDTIDTNGITIRTKISDNTGNNKIGIKLYKNASIQGGVTEVAFNPSSTNIEDEGITAAEFTSGSVTLAAGDKVAVCIEVAIDDTETLDIYPMTFNYTVDPII